MLVLRDQEELITFAPTDHRAREYAEPRRLGKPLSALAIALPLTHLLG